jgi:hypothetical protein
MLGRGVNARQYFRRTTEQRYARGRLISGVVM